LDQLLQRKLCQLCNSSNITAFLSFGTLLYLLLKYIAIAHSLALQEIKVLMYGPVFCNHTSEVSRNSGKEEVCIQSHTVQIVV